VVNNSWGSNSTLSTEFLADVRAWVAAGIFPAFANGNNGPGTGTVGSPGSFPESFGVGATDINDQIASFSSRGPVVWDGVRYLKPQVSAPGAQIYSSWPRQLGEGDYNTISGTSMATPHAAAVAAVIRTLNSSLTASQVVARLDSAVDDEGAPGRDPSFGFGRVNLVKAATGGRDEPVRPRGSGGQQAARPSPRSGAVEHLVDEPVGLSVLLAPDVAN
jgi:subtilisin family serine protease